MKSSSPLDRFVTAQAREADEAGSVFSIALERYYGGRPDPVTLDGLRDIGS